jgi:hypothetical protein
MAEYIEREAACSLMPDDYYGWRDKQFLKSVPAADVAPVRHGKWVWDEDGIDWGIGSWRCSECHTRPETWWQGKRSTPYNKSGHYYCPNCGAKMDGEADG